MFIILYQFRNDLLDCAYYHVVGNLVDGCFGIAVHRDDDTRILHTGDVLNLTADTASDIHLGMHGDTRLTNLTVVVYPSCINGSTTATYLAMKHLGKLEELVESLF